MKKMITLSCVLAVLLCACGNKTTDSNNTQTSSAQDSAITTAQDSDSKESEKDTYENPYADMTASEIAASLTLEEKANQMVIPAIYMAQDWTMSTKDYGSILSTNGMVEQTATEWAKIIDGYQESALRSEAAIPFLYGQDSVHGVNYCLDTVIFPHNINIGAANDPDLTYQMGLAVADEMKMTKMIWNYAPCVAVSTDPRWGRTYESYSSEAELVQSLGSSFTQGLLDGGVIACAKHYIGDGSVLYGTGETSYDGETRLIDRGNAELSEEEVQQQLAIYQNLIDEGVQSIMISHSALNGIKMHENADYINDVLRNDLGFEGVVVSDWDSIHNINGSDDYKEQIIISVNAGIDWLMEPEEYDTCAQYLVEAVQEGRITEERIHEAVTRIIQLKMDAGLFDDPFLEQLETAQSETGSQAYRELACKLAEESQVLIKNDNDILPLKDGATIFVTGPAADDTGVQCGGWTRQWLGMSDVDNGGEKLIENATTILEGLQNISEEYHLTILTDPEKAAEADVTLLCLGEQPYAEWHGDTADLSITGSLAMPENKDAIALAESLDTPTVTLLVTGRNVIIEEEKDKWDGIVMCGLFGSEGQSVANVLTGKAKFTGKLAMPWYASVDDIPDKNAWLDIGYGLTYPE